MEAAGSPETSVPVSKNIRLHMSEDNREQNDRRDALQAGR
jgi:hypothetical protein